MLDRYWHGSTGRISPEAPVPVVKVGQTEDRAGGAANVALNIAALGAEAKLTGIIGNDDNGASLKQRLKAAAVATDFGHCHQHLHHPAPHLSMLHSQFFQPLIPFPLLESTH